MRKISFESVEKLIENIDFIKITKILIRIDREKILAIREIKITIDLIIKICVKE